MKRSTITIALACIFALSLGLWYGPRLYRGTHAGSLPDLLGFAPPDSAVIFYADLASLRNTPWIDRLASAAPPAALDPDYAEFVRSTGFAFERDLDRVLLAERNGSTQTLVFADGRFDQEKIATYALRSGKLENHNGRPVYVLPSVQRGGKTIALAFLGNTRIVISDGGDPLGIPGAAPAGAPHSFAPALEERLSRVAGAPAFAVVNVSQSSAGGPVAAAALGSPTLLQGLRWISFAVQPQPDQLLLSAEGECDRPDQAQTAAAGLEFLRTMLRAGLGDPKMRGHMSADSAAAAAHFLEGARISAGGQRVRLLLAVTPDTLSFILPGPAKTPNSHDK